MADQELIIYGTRWCADCIRVRRFLNGKSVAFKWVDIDHDREAEQFVLKANRGMRSVPTIVLLDGTVLVEPSTHELAEKLNTLLI